MISRILKIALGTTVLFSSAAAAQQSSTGPYVAGATGFSYFWETELNNGVDLEYDFPALFLSAAGGFRLNPNLRAEAELLFESADIDNSSGDIDVWRATVSGYYDFASIAMFNREVTPYAGGGAGFAFVDLFDDEIELTWHIEGGATVPITDQIDLVPGLRFEYIGLDEGGVEDDSIWVTQLRAGVRYSF